MAVTEQEILAVLWAIHGVFPSRFPLPTGKTDADKRRRTATVSLWLTLLDDLPEGSALLSTRSALREAIHPPTPAEIRQGALAAKLVVTAGADAWGEVCRAIGAVGMYRSPRWSSPAIGRSVEAIGGWSAICKSDNAVADRSQFIRHFDGLQERARKLVLTGHAKSITEAIDGRQQDQIASGSIVGLIGKGEQ